MWSCAGLANNSSRRRMQVSKVSIVRLLPAAILDSRAVLPLRAQLKIVGAVPVALQ